MLSCEVALDVFQLHGGFIQVYDTFSGTRYIGYERKQYEKYKKQGNIWCAASAVNFQIHN
jgi:hypothetical protein